MAERPVARPPILSHSGVSVAESQQPLSVAAYTESYVQPTVAIATQPSVYSTKIVSTSSRSRIIATSAAISSQSARQHLPTTITAVATATTATTSTHWNQKRTQDRSVSLTGPRQPSPLKRTAQPPKLPESTHSATAEYSPDCDLRRIRMVNPPDMMMPYDWNPSQDHAWNGEPIPIDDLDLLFDPPTIPDHPHPHPQQYAAPAAAAAAADPTPEQNQAMIWSDEAMDRYIETAIGEEDLEGFDLDRLDEMLEEEEPLSEFFPMLGQSAPMPSHGAMAPPAGTTASPSGSLTPPMLEYHDMSAGTSMYPQHHLGYQGQQYQTTTTTTMTALYQETGAGTSGDWVRMGADEGRLDQSPTFMDTGRDLSEYMHDFEEQSTSRSSPDYESATGWQQPEYQQYQQYPTAQAPPTQVVTSARTTTTTRRRAAAAAVATVRHHPYAAPAAPAKRQPVFRPDGFGTPAIGENVTEYRKRRDKNNLSSARSRAKKADKVKEMKIEAVELEKKNIELKAVLDGLEREVAFYKEAMMKVLAK